MMDSDNHINLFIVNNLAERVGFEPTPPYRFSGMKRQIAAVQVTFTPVSKPLRARVLCSLDESSLQFAQSRLGLVSLEIETRCASLRLLASRGPSTRGKQSASHHRAL
jgi:hypothetical protein